MEKGRANSYELLHMTETDSDSNFELREIILQSPRKKKYRRKMVKSSSSKMSTHGPECWWAGRIVSLIFVSGVLLCWLVALTWFIVVLHSELRRLDFDVMSVVAGNQGIPDALQKCHSLSRELQQNQTDLRNRLNLLSVQLTNFSKQMSTIRSGLIDVQQRLQSSPELVSVPKILENLASLGSKVEDYVTTTDQLKQTSQNLEKAQQILESNITSVKQNLTAIKSVPNVVTSETEKLRNEEKEKVLNRIQKVEENIKAVNETLSEKLQWAVNDQVKDHSAIESLQTFSQNVSARVTSLQGVCSSQVLNHLNASVQKLENQFNSSMHMNNLKTQVTLLDQEKNMQDHPVLSPTDTSQSSTPNLSKPSGL